MFGWGDDAQQNYDSVNSNSQPHPNQATWSHEAIGAAAGFGAMKLFEDRQRRDGQPVSHALAKEALAGLAGFEIDRLAQTKGADFIDNREAVRSHAIKQTEQMYDAKYGNQDQYDPNSSNHPFQGNDNIYGNQYGNQNSNNY